MVAALRLLLTALILFITNETVSIFRAADDANATIVRLTRTANGRFEGQTTIVSGWKMTWQAVDVLVALDTADARLRTGDGRERGQSCSASATWHSAWAGRTVSFRKPPDIWGDVVWLCGSPDANGDCLAWRSQMTMFGAVAYTVSAQVTCAPDIGVRGATLAVGAADGEREYGVFTHSLVVVTLLGPTLLLANFVGPRSCRTRRTNARRNP